MSTLLSAFPEPKDLLSLEPEEFAGVLLEVIPSISQQAGFLIGNIVDQFIPPHGGGYPPRMSSEISVMAAEALAWLENQGIVVKNPNQPADWYLLTRRGRSLRTRSDLEAFRKGRALPMELLQPALASKVRHLFLRGDHDTAVFQAFKEVEVAVRRAGNYSDDLLGRDLMQKAFNSETGPLRDKALVKAERESEMFLFSGAIGHCKNPTSHRDVNLPRESAARLIVFASHLLDIIEKRRTAAGQP
jgi:uncharacterized protein (TIGR02391 family)